jgi:hypothetical protein
MILQPDGRTGFISQSAVIDATSGCKVGLLFDLEFQSTSLKPIPSITENSTENPTLDHRQTRQASFCSLTTEDNGRFSTG